MLVIDESGMRTLARISASVPFARSSLVVANALSKLRPHFAFASAVASWTIASGLLSSTALRTPRVEQVEHHRLGAERPQQLRARRRVVGTDHIVACVDQGRARERGRSTTCPGRRSTTETQVPRLTG